AAGLLEEAQTVVDRGRAYPADTGAAYLDEAEGRILLASGSARDAREILMAAAREAARCGFRLAEWRARTLAAEALAVDDSREQARLELAAVDTEADAAKAMLIRDAAHAAAGRLGLVIPEPAELTPTPDAAAEP